MLCFCLSRSELLPCLVLLLQDRGEDMRSFLSTVLRQENLQRHAAVMKDDDTLIYAIQILPPMQLTPNVSK